MLKATNVYKPVQQRSDIEVTIINVTDEPDHELAAAAMAAAHETPGRLFGWYVRRFDDDTVLVHLHRD